jgi:hypothetical protein
MTSYSYVPVASVTGVSKFHVERAVKWLRRAYDLPAFWRRSDRSLNAFADKHGLEGTDKLLREALNATR